MRSRGVAPLLLASVCLVAVLAWWWPGLTGQGARSEVTIIGTGEIAEAREVVSRRIREAGLSVRWEDSVTTWCEASELLEARETGVVVMAPDDLRPCTAKGEPFDVGSIASRHLRRLVLVGLDPTSIVEDLEGAGARRVVTERLIGAVDESMPCLWWDDCPTSATVVTRTDGGLTDAGRQRLARLITARVS
ncbi:MAG: hypothetical protein ACO3SP_08415 [Ilumatobacteraceae bacterium]